MAAQESSSRPYSQYKKWWSWDFHSSHCTSKPELTTTCPYHLLGEVVCVLQGCKDGREPELSADCAQEDGDSESSYPCMPTYTHPSTSKTQMKSWLPMAQPHLGYRLTLNILSWPQASTSSISQRKAHVGGCCHPVWSV